MGSEAVSLPVLRGALAGAFLTCVGVLPPFTGAVGAFGFGNLILAFAGGALGADLTG